MAVTLPTITVTDAQGARILDAFKAKYGTTTTPDTVAAYKRELARHIKSVVLDYEAQKFDAQNASARAAALAAVEAELPDPNNVS